jgi:tRNA threonylcarbamoyladenosine biosynthesis protein TsaE
MRVELRDEAATLDFGARLAAARPPMPSRAMKVALHGDLGAGKTTLTRGFLRSLGVAGSVRSPTFSLLESYELEGLTVVHLDLYRLRNSSDVRGLGLADYDHHDCLWMVEWPERATGVLGDFDLEVTLQVAGDGRQAELSAGSEVGRQWLQAM